MGVLRLPTGAYDVHLGRDLVAGTEPGPRHEGNDVVRVVVDERVRVAHGQLLQRVPHPVVGARLGEVVADLPAGSALVRDHRVEDMRSPGPPPQGQETPRGSPRRRARRSSPAPARRRPACHRPAGPPRHGAGRRRRPARCPRPRRPEGSPRAGCAGQRSRRTRRGRSPLSAAVPPRGARDWETGTRCLRWCDVVPGARWFACHTRWDPRHRSRSDASRPPHPEAVRSSPKGGPVGARRQHRVVDIASAVRAEPGHGRSRAARPGRSPAGDRGPGRPGHRRARAPARTGPALGAHAHPRSRHAGTRPVRQRCARSPGDRAESAPSGGGARTLTVERAQRPGSSSGVARRHRASRVGRGDPEGSRHP